MTTHDLPSRVVPPVAGLRPGEVVEIPPGLDEDAFPGGCVGAATPEGARTVVARALPDPVDSTMLLVDLLAVGMPVLPAIVGGTTW